MDPSWDMPGETHGSGNQFSFRSRVRPRERVGIFVGENLWEFQCFQTKEPLNWIALKNWHLNCRGFFIVFLMFGPNWIAKKTKRSCFSIRNKIRINSARLKWLYIKKFPKIENQQLPYLTLMLHVFFPKKDLVGPWVFCNQKNGGLQQLHRFIWTTNWNPHHYRTYNLYGRLIYTP